MNNRDQSKLNEKDVTRIVLDKDASRDFLLMVESLKKENPFVKAQPSAFVSFLVSDFYRAYFEKDKAILLAQFFDSQAYYESQLRLAKSAGNFEEAMSDTLGTIRKIKAKAHRKTGRPRKNKADDAEAKSAV